MSVKPVIDEIAIDVEDLLATNFDYTTTYSVPYDSDPGLTYEGGKTKWGKIIETCVLYVDVRGSVQLNKDHSQLTMGKLYTAFTKSVIKAGRHHEGHTRNIIGDRVMIVFDSADCCTNAVQCAISINHIAKKIINVKFKTVNFRCGIGIDYGSMKVIKVGVPRKGSAAIANRGLVWAGKPANFASRLTDQANKTIEEIYYEVYFRQSNRLFTSDNFFNYMGKPYGIEHHNWPPPSQLGGSKMIEMSETDFMSKIQMKSGHLYAGSDKVIHFEKKTRSFMRNPILVTDRVISGLMREEQKIFHYQFAHFKREKPVKDVDTGVMGLDRVWVL